MTKAAIVGVGQTEFSSASGRSEMKLALEAILEAMTDAGLEIGEIDGFVRYTWDKVWEASLTTALGLKDVRYYGEVEHGGVNCCAAVGQAAAAIESNRASCVVVYRALNARSGTRYGRAERLLAPQGEHVTVAEREPPGDIYTAPFGLLVPPQFHALYARRYFHEYGLSDEAGARMLASIAVTQREFAKHNPRAMMRDRPLTTEMYLAERMLASPLRKFDLCLETDGAMALVLVSAERARRLKGATVELLASRQHIRAGSAPMALYTRDLHSLAPPHVAADLFSQAGITPDDIDIAQIYDASSILIPITLEDFGLIPRGGSHDFFTSGANRLDGQLPVNTNGGLLSEGYFHGLNAIAEAIRQLRGTSPNQVRDAEVALVTVRGASSLVLGRT